MYMENSLIGQVEYNIIIIVVNTSSKYGPLLSQEFYDTKVASIIIIKVMESYNNSYSVKERE